ncbi:MAG TPA: LemA family protein [Candidatus Baltobacteraceae bacterium]|nr:LemA family protein [Candidatus Baltobacteraceae bacterium]
MEQAQPQRRAPYAIWIALAIGVIVVISMISSYNALVGLSQAVDAQWGQVQNVYQRRADLVPNLVATVKGAANFEKSTYIAVTQARAGVGQISPDVLKNAVNDPKAMAQFEQAQNSLGSALSRLLVTVENYPQLKANENFLTLQAQLEGTENRIAVERRRYNEAAQAFNTRRNTFPTNVYASFFGAQFANKSYFQAQPGAQAAPQVNFQ